MAETPSPLTQLFGALRWTQVLAEELQRAPETLRDVRIALEELGKLPAQLDDLIGALRDTTTILRDSLPELRPMVEHLDAVVSDLGRTLTNVIGGIPGARRALRGREVAPPA